MITPDFSIFAASCHISRVSTVWASPSNFLIIFNGKLRTLITGCFNNLTYHIKIGYVQIGNDKIVNVVIGRMEWPFSATVWLCHTAVLPYCHSAIFPYCCTAILLYCHSAIVPLCHTAVLLYCHTPIVPYCYWFCHTPSTNSHLSCEQSIFQLGVIFSFKGVSIFQNCEHFPELSAFSRVISLFQSCEHFGELWAFSRVVNIFQSCACFWELWTFLKAVSILTSATFFRVVNIFQSCDSTGA